MGLLKEAPLINTVFPTYQPGRGLSLGGEPEVWQGLLFPTSRHPQKRM